MDLTIEGWNGVQHVVELGEDDTPTDMRRKVASAVELPEDGFVMNFGCEAMGEGADMTQLSAGDKIVLTKSMKFEARAALHALGETDITAKRLKTVKDPEVACLLLQAEVTTVIPDDFLSRVPWVGMSQMFTRLDLSAVSTVTRIESNFLSQQHSLTALDLSSLTSVTHIGYRFLSRCSSLTALDLSSLTNVTHIGTGFLSRCSSLTSLDLSSLSSLEWINDEFLKECSSLTELDLSSLDSVTHVGRDFCEMTKLQTIRLSGCSAVVSRAVKNRNLSKFVVDARPKRKRDKSPDEDRKRSRLSQ